MFSGKSKRSKIAKVYCMNVSWKNIGILSGQISHSVVSNSLRPHEPQHTRPPCPSPTPGVHSDSHPSSQWCHLAISSSVVPFSSCPQIPPASESFPMSQLFAWGGQSTGVSALASFTGSLLSVSWERWEIISSVCLEWTYHIHLILTPIVVPRELWSGWELDGGTWELSKVGW